MQTKEKDTDRNRQDAGSNRRREGNGPIERIEAELLTYIQEKDGDTKARGAWKAVLAILKVFSWGFHLAVLIRHLLYRLGVFKDYRLGVQVISIGNVTAGGTGKTPVTELLARTLAERGRKVAILSRGYRRKEAPLWRRLFTQIIVPPLVVSDGKRILLGAETGGDEPYMLANNLPGVAVVVDRNRVKAGRYAIKHFGCNTLILDDGFQYLHLRHTLEIVLVDSTNPFGNGNMLPRGILREPVSSLKRADFIFLTKCNGDVSAVRDEIRKYNKEAEIVECNHEPKLLKDVWTRQEVDLDWLKDREVCSLAGIASPQGFVNSLRNLGAKVVLCPSFPDHHRYTAKELIYHFNRAAEKFGIETLITTEKDAVRFPLLVSTPVRCLYLRIVIRILSGSEYFDHLINHICNLTGKADANGK